MKIRVTVSGDLADAIRTIDRRGDQLLTDSLTEIGSVAADLAASLAPERTGRFIDTIGYEVQRNSVEVGSTSRRAHLVEAGRGPGRMPPPTLIASIFDVDDAQAFQIARAIGRNGTEGAKVFELTRRAMRPDIKRVAGDLADALSLRRNRG